MNQSVARKKKKSFPSNFVLHLHLDKTPRSNSPNFALMEEKVSEDHENWQVYPKEV